MTDFYCILTDVGRALIANSQLTGNAILITDMAVGSGDGELDQSMTELRNEVWRGPVMRRGLSPTDSAALEIEARIPPEVGGWIVREAGLFDAEGSMVAIARLAEFEKPALAQGSGVDTYIKLIVLVENADNVTLKLDPAIIMASRTWVLDLMSERDLAISLSRIMFVRDALRAFNIEQREADQDEFNDGILRRLSSLEHNLIISSERASRAILS